MPVSPVASRLPTIVAVDHPILDLILPTLASELTKYGLEQNSQILATPEHSTLYESLESNPEASSVPGGAALNSLRSAMWWFKKEGKKGACAIVGAIGKDKAAARLQDECHKVNIVTRFTTFDDYPTAKCGILVCDTTRTMVTELGAAAQISLAPDGAVETEVVPLLGQERDVVFTTSYYVAKDSEGAKRLISESKGRYEVVISLAATWAAGLPAIGDFMKGAKIVFGTIAEAKAFSAANGGPDGDDDVVKYIQALPGVKDRWLIITDGPEDVRFASDEGLRKFPVPQIDPALIKDDNGAGDSFAGAFLASYITGSRIEDSIASAMSASRVVLQNVGCAFEMSAEPVAKRLKVE